LSLLPFQLSSNPFSAQPTQQLLKTQSEPGAVMHACNPSTQEVKEVEAGGIEFKVSLGYTVRPYQERTER
jgi:hypothetical protein